MNHMPDLAASLSSPIETCATSRESFDRLKQGVQLLNSECFCIQSDPQTLKLAVEETTGNADLYKLIEERNPHVFSASPVFVSSACIERMAELIQAIEAVVALPSYREAVFARSPEIARNDQGGAKGVFFGYDFHLNGEGMGLIEINTNAGGAMLNAVLARAQRACCEAVSARFHDPEPGSALEREVVAMFRSEWHHSGHSEPLTMIAIVDDQPETQYLYAEFLLFQSLFRKNGIEALIVSPDELVCREGRLRHAPSGQPIDLVYNRHTDFMLAQPSQAALRQAYSERLAVVTPHPAAHALYADKRNLELLSNPDMLEELAVSEPLRRILLAGIPRTQQVTSANAEELWQNRRRLFFKPHAGFGSRAAYRGEKLTKRVWEEILQGGYVAQQLVPPGERVVREGEQPLKFDIRCYVYEGRIQAVAARLYQGQTTNFRTPGGGFAPVYALTPEFFIHNSAQLGTQVAVCAQD